MAKIPEITQKLLVVPEIMEELENLKEELAENKNALLLLNDSYQTLVVQERMRSGELLEARKALVKGLGEIQTGTASIIGIKRIGELNVKPFRNACELIYPKADIDFKSTQISSMWQEEIENPCWHPFKRIEVDGKYEDVIDETDKRLQNLKNELGEEVYVSVTTALLEMEEYNPSGRFVVQELWNFKEKRKASVTEVIEYLFEKLKNNK